MLELVEATGLSILEVAKLPMVVANVILRRGGVQEGRHRELRLLGASATAIHAQKLKVDDLLKDVEKVRYPERLKQREFNFDHNRERALAALKARRGV